MAQLIMENESSERCVSTITEISYQGIFCSVDVLQGYLAQNCERACCLTIIIKDKGRNAFSSSIFLDHNLS